MDTSVTPQEASAIAAIRGKHALVVDDSAAQRLVLAKNLERWGYHVVQAASGDAALQLCETTRFDLIVSDWMMPGMNGLDFCRAFRARAQDRYSYFILLTSKNDKSAVAEGLNVGADDFLSKPVSTPELRARIFAGERLLAMERQVKARNDELHAALRKLQALYDAVDRDLMEARKLQQSLIRDRFHDFGGSQLSLMLHSSGHVGGDMVGTFPINAQRVGIYSLDVSGHGVAAALLGARIGGMFGGAQSQNIALSRNHMTGQMDAVAPHDVAARMNTLMLQEIDTEAYLTIAYADLDLSTGRLSMVQAGHPHPVIQRRDGGVEYLGEGGLPIGLLEEAEYSSFEAELRPGDRLFLYSDGITECANAAGDEFGESGLSDLFTELRKLRGLSFLDALKWGLAQWSGRDEFGDDISGALLEFSAYRPSAPPKQRYYRGQPMND
ncbi:PP2C family protein-serine/threonine phosphatase [Roseinatronobacter ekhonensis]|uniref:PP2C family protein-serine/threonine phosphatase n=1 Tax=Roseinatronobacter ekhonensis TaxID=254356 RepID=UPI001FEA0D4A|nr:SpoIIE family protein phosphatase [Roseibaca ekhonensis]